MDDAPFMIGMKPSHPGEFIREEILNELVLSVARAAEVLGVRRATLSDLVNETAALSPEMAYLVLRQVAGKWKMPPREWCEAKTQFAIMFDERFVAA